MGKPKINVKIIIMPDYVEIDSQTIEDCQILVCYLQYLEKHWKIFSNFVVFSEYMNLNMFHK
jgi:hypothetical protein